MGRNSKAQDNALGRYPVRTQAQPGRNNYRALTALDQQRLTKFESRYPGRCPGQPRALPWALTFRTFSACC